MLAVDKGVVLLPVLAAVREGYLDVVTFHVDDRIKGLFTHGFREQVQQTVFGDVAAPVEVQDQSLVEVRVVPAHFFNVFRPELGVCREDFLVRVEGRAGAVGLVRAALPPRLGDFLPPAELVGTRFSVPVGLDFKKVGKGVDRLDAHAVEAHGFFKGVAVVFGPGVDLGGAVQQFSQRDAAAEVAHLAQAVWGDVDGDLFAESHDEFVNGVVDDFFQQDVNAVVR